MQIFLMAFMALAGIGQSFMQLKQQKDLAERQGEALEAQLLADYGVLTDQQEEANEKATIEKLERDRQAMRMMANDRVAAAESGIQGVSVLKQINNRLMQADYDKSVIELNRQSAVDQADRQMRNSYTQAQTNKPSSPSTGTAALQMFLSGMMGAGQGYMYAGGPQVPSTPKTISTPKPTSPVTPLKMPWGGR